MIQKLFVLILILINSVVSNADFVSKFEEAKTAFRNQQTLKEFTNDEIQRFDNSSFIMIDGIFGDLIQNQFVLWQTFLKANLPNSDSKIIRPSSFQDILQNSKELAKELLNSSHLKKKIVIAHSRGAAELFISLLSDPAIFEMANISKVILIQGAFSGTPIADLISEDGLSLSTNDSLKLRAALQKKLSSSDRMLFQKKVFFVRSESQAKDCPLPLKASAIYLNHFYNSYKNDCLLLSTHQRIPHLGVDLGILQADHLGLLTAPKHEPKLPLVFLTTLLREVL